MLTGSPLTPGEKGYRTRLLKQLEGKQSPILEELYDIVCKLEILNEHSAKLGQEAEKLIKEIREYMSKKEEQNKEGLAKPITSIKDFIRLLCNPDTTGSKIRDVRYFKTPSLPDLSDNR